MSIETMPHFEETTVEHDWDFSSKKDRNRIQLEVMSELDIPHEEQADWMFTNAPRLGEIIDEDPDFADCVNSHDWEGAKKILIEKLNG